MKADDIKDLLKKMNFFEIKENIWIKNYNFSQIKVDFNQNKIIYDNKIKIGRNTITNFSKSENFVVLECVNRLLEKGYKSENIELEKDYGDAKDFIDILIKDYDKNAFAIIECKTYGIEYKKAISKAKNEGKQIFRYAVQDKNLSYILLYSSAVVEQKIDWDSKIIDLTKYEFNNREELFEVWDKTFENKGFFEDDIIPYGIEFKGITKAELKQISFHDVNNDKKNYEGSLYNQFAEIIRRHTISDKNNAYNKIFNLFLCKIVDEDEKMLNEEMDFQWKKGEDAETVLLRLNDLYKKGLKNYLDLEITDHSLDELNTLALTDKFDRLKEIFIEMRLYKNNEFAFIDVFDKSTFLENSEVVREIVKLLEDKQLKYNGKQQFLGDFFEKLLNIGIKQEEGQFFTPTPITEFIVKALPIQKIINEKIVSREPNFMPYVIDYACGSGHFLTEIMIYADNILKSIDGNFLNNKQLDNYNSWINGYRWAGEFIYGIEKDYRLSKTTKIACFLNGDGIANIICADGLSSFDNKKYKGKLGIKNDKKNEQFDLIIANPPYAVEGFTNACKDLNENFLLSKYINENSKEIECLFVERANQLLNNDGIAAIILPYSFLTSPAKIYIETRKLLLKNFDIVSIVKLGTEAFMATEMKTIIIFLQKKKGNINNFICCNLDHQTNKKLERKLLGYEFSNRKGSEGLKIFDGGILQNYQNENDTRMLNYYIKHNYLNPDDIMTLFEEGKLKDKGNPLYEFIRLNSYDECFSNDNNYSINIENSNYELPSFSFCTNDLGKLLVDDLISAKRPSGGVGRIESGVLSLGGGHLDDFGEINLDKPEYIPQKFFEQKINKNAILKKNDILMCKDGAKTGKVAFVHRVDELMVVNEHVFIIRPKDSIFPKYLFYYLYSEQGQLMLQPLKTRGGQGGINGTKLKMLPVPIVEKKIQKCIIEKCDVIMQSVNDKLKKKEISKVISEFLENKI